MTKRKIFNVVRLKFEENIGKWIKKNEKNEEKNFPCKKILKKPSKRLTFSNDVSWIIERKTDFSLEQTKTNSQERLESKTKSSRQTFPFDIPLNSETVE